MTGVAPTLSYCVVNTNGREYLLACLDAIERTHPAGLEREILVLDNASEDGSAEAVRALGRRDPADRARAADRQGARTTRPCCARRKGAYCLLLNEDSELRPGAAAALLDGARGRPAARRRRGRSCSTPTAEPVPCAWRFPGVGTALAGALFLHRLADRAEPRRSRPGASTGRSRARCWCAARRPSEVGYLDPDFFVYYDECDFCQAASPTPAGTRSTCPAPRRSTTTSSRPTSPRASPGSSNSTATATSTCASTTPASAPSRCAALTAWSYALRALAAAVLPGQPARVYWAHARQALFPNRGERSGIRTVRLVASSSISSAS